MNKHASEMNYQEIEAYLLENGRRAIWAGGSEPLGYKVDASAYLGVIRELKAHQSEQDAEIARLRRELESWDENSACDEMGQEIERLRAQLDGVIAAVDAEPIPKLHSLNAMSVVETTISSIKERILAAKGES